MNMKISKDGERINLNVTRYEAMLIKDAVYEMVNNRSGDCGTHEWDSQDDPIVAAQMNRCFDKIEF